MAEFLVTAKAQHRQNVKMVRVALTWKIRPKFRGYEILIDVALMCLAPHQLVGFLSEFKRHNISCLVTLTAL